MALKCKSKRAINAIVGAYSLCLVLICDACFTAIDVVSTSVLSPLTLAELSVIMCAPGVYPCAYTIQVTLPDGNWALKTLPSVHKDPPAACV